MQPRDADTHVIAYADNYNDGRIKTFNVAADGTTVTNVNTWEHDSGNGTYNSLARRSDDVYALAYRASSNRGNIRTFKVAANGTISSLNVLQFDTQTSETSLIQLKGDLFLLAYPGSSDDGMIKSFNIGTNGSISGLKTL
jgi:6-phosphogluconolactonase (cycloisomerase 2 family)